MQSPFNGPIRPSPPRSTGDTNGSGLIFTELQDPQRKPRLQ